MDTETPSFQSCQISKTPPVHTNHAAVNELSQGNLQRTEGAATASDNLSALSAQQQLDFAPNFDHRSHPHIDIHKLKLHHQRVTTSWPTITPEATEEFPDFAKLYTTIKDSNLPNFIGARMTVASDLNLGKWEEKLQHYHDRQICDFLRFGWPVGYEADSLPSSVQENHQSGKQHLPQVRKFIQKELGLGALVGPFTAPPFHPWTRVSPILTRPKKDSDTRRIIIDLSFPAGQAVNNGIDITSIFGQDSTYVLPSINDLTSKIVQYGQGCWMWKADLSRAYRQLRVDPLDCPLLGLKVDGRYYIDRCPSFGCRSSSAACQRTSNALTYILAQTGCAIYAYLDDYASCAPSKDIANDQYNKFINTTQELGLKLAEDKCQAPTNSMEWLGFEINSIAMTVSIPKKKLQEVLAECQQWGSRTRTDKKRLQSLVGKLVHVSNAISHARKFTGRLLGLLRDMTDASWITISKEARLDIKWFLLYASVANGIALLTPETDFIHIECDACLTGAGANSPYAYYQWTFDANHIKKYESIHRLEAVNLLVSYKTLAPEYHDKKLTVVLLTDNMASSCALATGKTKDPVLGACARQMWLEAARRDQVFIIKHKPGVDIPLADALSRYHSDPSKAQYADKEVAQRHLNKVEPVLDGYQFFTPDF